MSIRRRLLISILTGVVFAALACGGLLYHKARESLLAQFDSALQAKVRALASLLEVDGGWLEFNYVPEVMPEYEGGQSPEYFQISFDDGRVLRKSTTLGDADLPLRHGTVLEEDYWDLDLPDGRPGRAMGILAPVDIGIETDDDGDDDNDAPDAAAGALEAEYDVHVVLVAARARTELDTTLATLRDAAWLAGGVLFLLVGIVVLAGVGRGLRPLEVLAEQVSSIDADSLSRRIPGAALPLELKPMVGKLNELLARLEAAFERERRITGNVAHELRSPIAELRSATEVALRWPDDAELVQSAVETANSVAVRMGDLIAGLLRLARVAVGEAELKQEDIDLRELVEDLWAGHEPLARERGLTFDLRVPSGLLLRTDRALLSNSLGNLLENAATHCVAGGNIVCTAAASAAGGIFLQLENPTESLAPEDLGHLTEPFWQKDPSRSDTSHSGLGLALASSIAEALGMRLEFELDSVFRVVLRGGSAVFRPRSERQPA